MFRRTRLTQRALKVQRGYHKVKPDSDGIVVHPLKCELDYALLTCGRSNSPHYLTAAQIAALRSIYDSVRDAAGRRLTNGYPHSGSEVGVGNVGWDRTLMSPTGTGLAGVIMERFLATPIPSQTFDFAAGIARYHAAVNPVMGFDRNLRPFFERGGKLMLCHGWSDPILPPEASLDIYDDVMQRSGPRAASQFRLFMIPATLHCSGGTGADASGQTGAADAGVGADRNTVAAVSDGEVRGRTPTVVIGRHGRTPQNPDDRVKGPIMERPQCAWPTAGELRSGADPNVAASHTCRR
jgi:hypothetical protein